MADYQFSRPILSFVVPCYNEAEGISATVKEITIAADLAKIENFEIVIIDDCSTDNTAEIASRLARENGKIVLVRNSTNLGFGGAYKAGVRHAQGIYVIMIPGDNAHPAPGVLPILEKMGEADIVIPYSSNPEARSRARQIISAVFTKLINTLFGLNVPYFNGLVLHKLDLLRNVAIETNGYAYQAEALVKLLRAGATYTVVPVEIAERTAGKSRAFHFKNIYRVVKTLWRLWFHIHASQLSQQLPPGRPTSDEQAVFAAKHQNHNRSG